MNKIEDYKKYVDWMLENDFNVVRINSLDGKEVGGIQLTRKIGKLGMYQMHMDASATSKGNQTGDMTEDKLMQFMCLFENVSCIAYEMVKL